MGSDNTGTRAGLAASRFAVAGQKPAEHQRRLLILTGVTWAGVGGQ